MNTLFALISICLLAVGVYLALFKPISFTFFWAIFGSSYDGCGIMMYLDSCFGYYRLIMNHIVLLCFLVSIWRFYKKPQTKTSFRFMAIAILFVLGILISQSLYFIIHNISLINFSYGFIEYGPLIFIIWLANYKTYNLYHNSKYSLTRFVLIQVMIAAAIVYLPQFGIHILDNFGGGNYISDGNIYNQNILMNIFDLPKMFVNKYLYNGLGQFHNGNDMGFYGIVGLLLSIFLIVKSQKLWKKILGLGFALLSLLLWGNSGMRGPVVGLICGVIIVYILWKKPSKWITGLLGASVLLLFLFSETGMELISYLIPESGNISYVTRADLRINGLNYLKDNWLIGEGGLLANLTAQNIDPHELPFRISCLFGLFTGVMCFILVYVYPVWAFIRTKNKEAVTIIFWFILFFVSITDNYTCIGLFWILFSEAICSMCIKRNTEKNEKTVDTTKNLKLEYFATNVEARS